MKLKTYTIILSALLPLMGLAQSRSISLEEALRLAKQHYPQMQAAQLNIDKYDKLKATAFDLGTTSVVTGKEDIKNNRAGAVVNFGVSQSDIDILGIASKRKYQQSQAEVAQVEYRLTEKNIELVVRQAFNNLLQKKELLRVYQQIDTVYVNFLKSAELRYKTEETSKLALLTAQAKYNELKLQLTQLEGEQQSAMVNLNQYLGLEEDFTIYETPEIWPDLETVTMEGNTDLALMQAKIQQAKREWKVQKAAILPKFSATYTNKKIEGISGYHSYELGLSVPLLSGAWAQQKASKIQWQIEQEDLKTQQINLESSYLQKKIEINNLKDVVAYYEEHLIPLSNEQIKAFSLAYKLGDINYLEFIQGIENSLNTKIDYINAHAQYRSAFTDILRMTN